MDDQITLRSYSELNENEILSFNAEVYPDIRRFTPDLIRWQFRVGFDKSIEPIYVTYKNKIVGQAGILPVTLLNGGNRYQATWYNRLIVSDSMRGKGAGKLLTKKWMEFAPIHITNCNDNSMAIFRKMGWEEEFNTVRFALPINLVKLASSRHWSGMKLAGTRFLNPLYKIYLHAKFLKSSDSEITNVQKLGLTEMVKDFVQDGDKYLIKDENWVRWRLLESPFRDQYYRLKCGESVIYFRLFNSDGVQRINILYQTFSANNKAAMAAIIHYALKNKIDLVWAISNIPELKRLYTTVLFDKLETRFAFHCNANEMMDSIRQKPIPIQGIDSDYDSMYL